MTLPYGRVKGCYFHHGPFESCYLFILTRQKVPELPHSGQFCCLNGKWSFSLNDTDSGALKPVLHRGIRQQTQMIGVLIGDFA